MKLYTKNELDYLTDRQIVSAILDHGSNGCGRQVIEYLFYDKCKKMLDYISREVFGQKIGNDELISELYIYLQKNHWEKLKNFDFRSKLTTWLSVVAVRFFIKKRDRLIGHQRLARLEEAAQIADKERHDLFIEKMDIYLAISRLSNPRDRFVITSIEIDGRDDKEIAEILDTKVSNIYNIKSRAKKQLSNIMKDYYHVN